jgi:hypothetical protein
VARVLGEQGGRLTLASPEGGIFEIIGGRYSDNIPNLDIYLKGFTGDAHRVNRSSRQAVWVKKPALTMVLTVQPQVIASLSSRKEFRGRGLLARILYSLPQSKVGYRDSEAPPVEASVRQGWSTLLTQILSLPTPGPDETIPTLRLSPEAYQVFNAFDRSVEVKLSPGGELDDLADWGLRLKGTAARLAALLHIGKWAEATTSEGGSVYSVYAPTLWENEISPQTMVSAVRIASYFEGHVKAAFAMMEADTRLAPAKKLWSTLSRWESNVFSVRDLWQRVRRRYSKVEELEEALNFLVSLGYLRSLGVVGQNPRGSKPSPRFEINPLAKQTAENDYSEEGDRTQRTQRTQNPSPGAVEVEV